MSELVDPNIVFEAAEQGIAGNYWGRDQWGADTWEYIFSEEEIAEANELLQSNGLEAVDKITIARFSELSDLTGSGSLILGKDEVSFQLKSGGILTLISLSKPIFTDEPATPESATIQVKKDLQVEDNYDDIFNVLSAGTTGKNLHEGVEMYADQMREVSTTEMIAISALTRMLPGNRDSA